MKLAPVSITLHGDPELFAPGPGRGEYPLTIVATAPAYITRNGLTQSTVGVTQDAYDALLDAEPGATVIVGLGRSGRSAQRGGTATMAEARAIRAAAKATADEAAAAAKLAADAPAPTPRKARQPRA